MPNSGKGGKTGFYRLFSIVIWLGLFAGCVTRTQPSSVSIRTGGGASIYPPPSFQGQWVFRDRILIFRRPPEAPVTITVMVEGQWIGSSYDIVQINHSEQGNLQLTLRSRNRAEPPQQKTFRPPVGNRLLEIRDDGTELLWIKTGH